MSAIFSKTKGNSTTLLPYQAAFVDIALSSSSKHIVMLRGDVGLGKTTAMAFAVARLLRERASARILVLCPAALRFQWTEVIKREGVPALIIDRYRFREMLETSANEELWPRGIAAVLSDSFAKQADIRASLASVHWDIVVADEVHQFSGTRADFLESMAAQADRVVLASLPGMKPPSGFSLESATMVDWWGEEFVDDEGRPLDVPPSPALREVHYTRNESESGLSSMIKAMGQLLEGADLSQKFAYSSLLKCFHSSPAPLEAMLRHFADGTEKKDEIDSSRPDDEGLEAPEAIVPAAVGNVREVAGQALKVLEDIQVDSKLATFVTLVDELADKKSPPKSTCVITDYLSTLYYLAAEIEEHDIHYELIHGDMGRDARQESLRSFKSAGGALLATRAAMSEGVDLAHVTDLVLYDLPHSRLAIQQVIGRFNRLGRKSRLNIHALTPQDGPDDVDFEPIRLLHEVCLEQ